MAKLRYKTKRKYDGGRFWFINARTKKLSCTAKYIWVTTLDGYSWSRDEKRWFNIYDENDRPKTGGSISHARCNTVRAFRRRLKQWSKYLPKGVKFILCGRIDDFEVSGKTT